MNRSALKVGAAILITVILPRQASSQHISDALRVSQPGLHYNARALGLGNAYSTLGYDFSAVRFNPATMAVSDKFSWSTTVNADAFKSQSDYYGSRVNFTTTNMTGGQIGLTVPVRLDSIRTLVIGLGYTQAKDFNVGYKFEGLNAGSLFPSFIQVLAGHADPTTRALGLSYPTFDASNNYLGDQTILGAGMYERGYLLDEGGLTHFTFGAALEAAHNVFVGASGSYNTGHYTSDLELSATDINDVYPTGIPTVPGDPQTDGFVRADYRAVRDKQYRGWDARFGILYKLGDFIGLSTSFKLPNSHEVTEKAFISGRSLFSGNRSIVLPESTSTSKYSFKPPAEMTVGGMVNLWVITGTAEATYVDYASMKITSGVGSLPDQTLIDKRIKDELASVLNLNVGAEFHLPFTGLSARAGAIYQPSPFKSDPGRFAQKALTAGFGIDSNQMVQLDIGYAYGWRGERKNPQTGDDTGADQTVDYHTVLFTMRVAY